MNVHNLSLCTPAEISTYRAQCDGVMRRAGIKKDNHDNVKLKPDVERKLEEALEKAKGSVTPEMAEEMMRDGDGEGDFEAFMEQTTGRGGDGMSCEVSVFWEIGI